jgi:D-alanine-D-alanine ligase
LEKFDLAWNLFETFNNIEQNSYLGAALLHLSQIPFTGSTADSIFLTRDKRHVKSLLTANGIKTPSTKFKPGKWIIKTAFLHGSVGITVDSVKEFSSEHELQSHLSNAGKDFFAEQYIDGSEYSVTLLDIDTAGLKPVSASKLLFLNKGANTANILTYDSKWLRSSSEYSNTVRSFDIPADFLELLFSISHKIARLFSLQGFARIDFRADHTGNAYCIDINVNPSITDDSGFMASCRQFGMNNFEILEHIIKASYENFYKK